MQTLTLVCFWMGTVMFVYGWWLNWRAYKRWQRKYEEMLRDDYLREFGKEC